VILDGLGEEDLYIFNHHRTELWLQKGQLRTWLEKIFHAMSFFLCTFAADLVTTKVSKGNAVEVGDSPAAVTLKSEVRKGRSHFGTP
jgi:hypothetical protein